MFDGDGNRLVPTHAQKKSKRYRYYVSSSLHEQARESDADGFRIAAQELEDAVISGIKDFLTDEARLMDWLESREDSKEELSVREVMARAKEAVVNIQMNARQSVPAMVQRIMFQNDRMDIALRSEVLMVQGSEDDEPVWLSVPVVFRRTGQIMKLVLNNLAQTQKTEKRLIDLLTKAHDWFGRLTSGKSEGVGAIAAEEGCSASFVTRVIYLAFLAPDIVERIVRGDCPAELTAEKLIRMLPLPADWKEQIRRLGIP